MRSTTQASQASAAHRLGVAPVRLLAVGPAPSSRSLVWHLESDGWTPLEAGNLVAVLNGLKPAWRGWTAREIDHLRFLRALVKAGRIGR